MNWKEQTGAPINPDRIEVQDECCVYEAAAPAGMSLHAAFTDFLANCGEDYRDGTTCTVSRYEAGQLVACRDFAAKGHTC